MSDVYLIRGGPCLPVCLPFCGPAPADRLSHLNYPTRVAGEYGRGRFTLGSFFDVLNNGNFRDAVAAADVGVGDFISLLLVPEKHTVSDVFVEIDPEGGAYAPIRRPVKKNAAGAVFSVEFRVFNKDGSQTQVLDFGTIYNDLDAAAATTMRAAVNSGAGHFVPKGSWLEVGLKVEAMPSDTLVDWSTISTGVAVVVKVDDYQCPTII